MSETNVITIIDNDNEIDNPSFYSSIIKCIFGIIYSYYSENSNSNLLFTNYEVRIVRENTNNYSTIKFYGPPFLTVEDFTKIYNLAKTIVKTVSKLNNNNTKIKK